MLAKRAEKLGKRTTAYGVLPWMEILTTVLGLLASCRKPPAPAPVNPTPNPTPAQTAAWDDAWKLKANADAAREDDGSYAGPAYKRTRASIRKQNRRDGHPIKADAADAAATAAFDDARASTMADLYSDVLEARHAT